VLSFVVGRAVAVVVVVCVHCVSSCAHPTVCHRAFTQAKTWRISITSRRSWRSTRRSVRRRRQALPPSPPPPQPPALSAPCRCPAACFLPFQGHAWAGALAGASRADLAAHVPQLRGTLHSHRRCAPGHTTSVHALLHPAGPLQADPMFYIKGGAAEDTKRALEGGWACCLRAP
jgi:hypothetical protein